MSEPFANLNLKDVERELIGPHVDHDFRMAPPEGVAADLRSFKPTLRLLYNRRGKIVPQKSGSYDVDGTPRRIEYEPRWELWDTDGSGFDYLVMVLRDEDDNYREPGHWIVERMRRFDPARFETPAHWVAYVHAYNQKRVAMHAADWDGFMNFAADWLWRMAHPIALPLEVKTT